MNSRNKTASKPLIFSPSISTESIISKPKQ